MKKDRFLFLHLQKLLEIKDIARTAEGKSPWTRMSVRIVEKIFE
jgi:hypothetical protein